MHTAHNTLSVTLSSRPAQEFDVDLMLVPVFENDDFADQTALDAASGGEIGRARARGELTGKLYDVVLMPMGAAGWQAGRAVLVGAGVKQAFTPDRLRRIAIAGGLAARQRRVERLAVLDRPYPGLSTAEAAQLVAEGLQLANYDGATFKTGDPSPCWLRSADLRVTAVDRDVEQAVERGRVLGECTNHTRALANEPGNELPPRRFAERVSALARAAGLDVDVIDEAGMARLNMGLLLGVARGSAEPPRLVVMRYEPRQNAATDVVLGLVGKGITFDTGGISIKPAENMDKMKDDMSGGAAVLGAMMAIARLQAPVRCIGVIPMTENMPGGRAMKPGDVLTSAAGKTVEILNTDAEGRLVLGDALWYARQLGATHLVDIATLTGACVVALGKSTTGLFGSPDAWVGQVQRASERAGDRSWPLPVFEDYKELFKSEIADFANTGGRAAGAITGALFVKEFAGDLPWVHMDIAGTAWAEDAKPYQPRGATGVGVRTLAELALAAGTWSKLDLED